MVSKRQMRGLILLIMLWNIFYKSLLYCFILGYMLLYEFLLLVKVETHLAVAQQNHFSVISPTLKIFTHSEIKSTLGKIH